MSKKIAVSHPGKIGDALYALPSVRWCSEQMGLKADFYTSDYCKPMVELLEYQSYIDKVIIPPNYVIERMDMGVQPWQMPIDLSFYEKTIQMGFRFIPDRPLHKFIAMCTGVPYKEIKIEYEYPKTGWFLPSEPYYVLAPRGNTGFISTFRDVVRKSPTRVIQVGARTDYIGLGEFLALNMLDTVTLLSQAKGFIGLMSANLVLANGFSMPKVAPWDGKSWDMNHVIQSPTNFYPINPTADEILTLLGEENG